MWSDVELILVIMAFRQIFVDADSCPVKEDIVEIALSFSVKFKFVASYNHHVNKEYTYGTWKYVDPGREAADLFIMYLTVKGDIVVIQDIGLASTLLRKGVRKLSPKGILYKETKMQTALNLRYLHSKARKRGVYGKGRNHIFRKADYDSKSNLQILSEFTGIGRFGLQNIC